MKSVNNYLRGVLWLLSLLLISLVLLPITYGKYKTQETYTFEVRSFRKIFSDNVNKEETYTVKQTGYYLIQALGGEGGGAIMNPNDLAVYAAIDPTPVIACVYLEKGSLLSVLIGGGGCNGGKNSKNNKYGNGGIGGNRSKDGTIARDYAGGNGALAGRNSTNGGGGGGAASYVRLGVEPLVIAGGSGGNGTENQGTTAGGDEQAALPGGVGESAATDSKSGGGGGGGGGYYGGAAGKKGGGGHGGKHFVKSDLESPDLQLLGIPQVTFPPRSTDLLYGAKGIVQLDYLGQTKPN